MKQVEPAVIPTLRCGRRVSDAESYRVRCSPMLYDSCASASKLSVALVQSGASASAFVCFPGLLSKNGIGSLFLARSLANGSNLVNLGLFKA